MVVNAIAPWEGKIAWVGTPSGGVSQQTGEEWKSVEFVLAYTDSKLQERHIHLSAFGVDKVNRILSVPLGTTVRVTFSPTAREYNGKWYGKNEVYGITIQPQAQAQPQPAPQPAPQYAQPQYPQPAPVYQQPAPQYAQPTPSPALAPAPAPAPAPIMPPQPTQGEDDLPW